MAPASVQTRFFLPAIGGVAVAALLAGAASPGGAGCVSLTGLDAKPLARTRGLQAPPEGASVYGHVYTFDGKPVAGATVRAAALSDKVKKTAAGKTDQAGRYVLKGLSPAAIGVIVEHPRFGKLGPLPVRLWESMQGRDVAQTQQLDIGGLGDGARPLARTRNGKGLYVRTVKLPSKVRRFAPDGRGGMLALTAEGVLRVSPERSAKPVVRVDPPYTVRSAGAAPAATRVSGPGVPASDLFVGAFLGPFGNSGTLARYRPDGRKIWCLDLPVSPAELGVTGDGTTWLIGTSPQVDLAVRVTPGGRPAATYRLATGSSFDVAADKAGHAWLVNGAEGLVRIDASGKAIRHITLAAPAKSVFSTPDGGVWAVGRGVATRLDKNGRGVARLVLKQPLAHAAADGEGTLWLLEDNALYAVDGRTVTKHPLLGKTLPQAMSIAGDGGRHVWLLGPDRTTVAIVDLPCDCGH